MFPKLKIITVKYSTLTPIQSIVNKLLLSNILHNEKSPMLINSVAKILYTLKYISILALDGAGTSPPLSDHNGTFRISSSL